MCVCIHDSKIHISEYVIILYCDPKTTYSS